MIIGISGKIGSGKDTIGRIIQYLTCPAMGIQIEMKDWINKPDYNNFRPEWQIVKFADALKDIVCILTGCTREQLEDADFKNSKLPSEWEYWYNYHYKLITNDKKGILGKRYGSQFEVEREHDVLSNNINGHFFKCDTYTYRELLQYLGTDLLRNQLHGNVWVNALMSNYKSYRVNIRYGYTNEGDRIPLEEITKLPNWIITDVRFPNEAKAIKDRDGIVIKVIRNDKNKWIDKEEWDFNSKGIKPHESETALDNYKFDYVIDNNNTFDTLISSVRSILDKENIICEKFGLDKETYVLILLIYLMIIYQNDL